MTPSKKPSAGVSKLSAPPTNQEIAKRAHEIFLARGGDHGRDFEDWLEAESELLNERAARRKPQN